MKSKIKPHLEFVTNEKYPGKIGIHAVEGHGIGWWSEKSINNHLDSLRKELAFYEELYKQFCDLR